MDKTELIEQALQSIEFAFTAIKTKYWEKDATLNIKERLMDDLQKSLDAIYKYQYEYDANKISCPQCNHLDVGTYKNLNHCFVCNHEWLTT